MNGDMYRELISADLDGELREFEELGLWEHLPQCATCRGWRRDQIGLRHELQHWPEEALPSDLSAIIAPVTRPARNVYRVPRVLAWTAGIVLLVQSAVTASTLTSRSSVVMPYLTADQETVETIVLTARDRVQYEVHHTRQMVAPEAEGQNGG